MNPATRPTLEDRLREAAAHVESDLKRLVTYFNDEVVPDVRRNSSAALRSAAAELDRLAKKMEDARHTEDLHQAPPPPTRPGV